MEFYVWEWALVFGQSVLFGDDVVFKLLEDGHSKELAWLIWLFCYWYVFLVAGCHGFGFCFSVTTIVAVVPRCPFRLPFAPLHLFPQPLYATIANNLGGKTAGVL